MEAGRCCRQMKDGLRWEEVPEEELSTAPFVSVNSSESDEIDEGVGTELGLRSELIRKSQTTGSTASILRQSPPHSSSDPSDDTSPLNSPSSFCNTTPEHDRWNPKTTADPLQTSGPRSVRDGCSEKRERRELEGGDQDQAEVREEAWLLKDELQNSDESEDEELSRNKTTSYIYYQGYPGFLPALHHNLYMCIPCAEGFPSSEQLLAHVESHAAQETTVEAEDTEDRGGFTRLEDQDSVANLPPRSTKEDTGVALECHVCSVCSKSYMDVALLRQHERSHWATRPFSCNVCGKLFTQRGTMTRHMRSHLGLKPFACEECGMRFTRQYRKMEHMRIHSREKPYECQVCGVRFTQQRSVVSHLKIHTVAS